LVTTRTARHLRDDADTELVEVVDDEVSAQTLGEHTELSAWREVEVELVGGDATLLDEVEKRLESAGASPSEDVSKLARVLGSALSAEPAARRAPRKLRRKSPAGDVVGAYLATHFDALLTIDPRVRLDEPDAVHKMRVASRRLRSTLRTFGALFDPELATRLDVELRDLARALSGARDTEVQIAYFEGRVDELPDELVFGPVTQSIDNYLSEGLAASRDETLTMLRSERYFALVNDLQALVAGPLAGPANKPARTVLPKLVLAADKKLARKINKAQKAVGHERDLQLHSARKQAKRLRYAAEAVTSIYGGDATAFAKLAENIQEVLGTHQDACVARGLLREWGVRAKAAGEPTAFTFGVLLGLEECRAETAERDFFEFWPEASRRRHRRWLG
jgi:CHAD domain-containing protein